MNPGRPSTLERGAASNLRIWRSTEPDGGAPVLCLPPAGGQALTFRPLATAMPAAELFAIDLPGHGSRPGPPLTGVAAMAVQVLGWLDDVAPGPVVLLGHSFGACIATEVARIVARTGPARSLAVAIVCAADPAVLATAPLPGDGDDELLEFVVSHGGAPPELLARPEYLLPHLQVLAADLRAAQQYSRSLGVPEALDVPARIVTGARDGLVTEDLTKGWTDWLPRAERVQIESGHHAPRDSPAAVATVLAELRAELTAGALRPVGPPD